jgi:toxin-antitoxin system PIN domain toxin
MSGLGMIACDTNILFPALEASHPDHRKARAWLESMVGNESFALCELVLTEVYTLLRNAAICAKPLSAAAAVTLIENLRGNPAWLVLDHPGPGLMDKVWDVARQTESARRIYDIRLALTLRHAGVRSFATANIRDFRSFGFEKVWNPLA